MNNHSLCPVQPAHRAVWTQGFENASNNGGAPEERKILPEEGTFELEPGSICQIHRCELQVLLSQDRRKKVAAWTQVIHGKRDTLLNRGGGGTIGLRRMDQQNHVW